MDLINKAHVSSNLNGTYYSWGPGGWDTNTSASRYAEINQRFRSGVGVVLNLTQDQEKKLAECYAKKREKYSISSNNCGSPHKECLEEATSVSFSNSLLPVNIGNDLLNSSYLVSPTFHGGPSRNFFDDGFWAR